MKKLFSLFVVTGLFCSVFAGCQSLPIKSSEDTPADEAVSTEENDSQMVSFLSEPKLVDNGTVLNEDKIIVVKKLFGWTPEAPPSDFAYSEEEIMPKVYMVGNFNNGKYTGQDLYLIKLACFDMCYSEYFFRATLNKDSTLTLFTKYSSTWEDYMTENAGNIFDSTDPMAIEQLELPEAIFDLSTGTEFKINNEQRRFLVKESASKYELFSDKTYGSIYTDKETQCSFVSMPDGVAQSYDMIINFASGVNGSYDSMSGPTSGDGFDITWDNGTKEDALYSYKPAYSIGKCFYVEDSIPMTDLKETGKTSKGDSVYEFINPLHDKLGTFYAQAFPSYFEGEKPTHEEFAAKHPLFYWEDPYGRLIEFGKSEYEPAAEMGKPVIYLYPEKDTVVDVKVEPKNGLSVSEPSYGENGWKVLAKVGGSLLNLKDGETYPYLFWEGLNLDYRMPTKGFVVAQREVKNLLEEKLSILGLSASETEDFMEFWYPKFQDAPYYFVTFTTKEDFDKLAPLTVTPRPDAVIRVYMDYLPLSAPKKVTPPTLVTPDRKGFTVVEWGGALHR